MTAPIVLFEDEGLVDLLPLLWWRSLFELRIGRKIILDRIAQVLSTPIAGVWTRPWISTVSAQRCGAPANQPLASGTILINGRWLVEDPVDFPDPPCVGRVEGGVAYIVCDARLASQLSPAVLLDGVRREQTLKNTRKGEAPGKLYRYPWDVLTGLSDSLERDWAPSDVVVETRLDPALALDQPDRVHIGERTRIHPTTVLESKDGTIFISHDVDIGPYAVLRGPLYLGPGCRIMPHAHLHGGNAIGPVCKIGGEVCGCIIHSYTNKQHTGFLGHSCVGSWVNIGAGTANSNLKNTYGKVRVPLNGKQVDTGLRFFGAVIGDHAKIGINATIPTGAVIGMGACVATTRVLPKYLPSFSWVTDGGVKRGDPLRILDIAAAAMARRNVEMTDDEVELMIHLGERVGEIEGPPW